MHISMQSPAHKFESSKVHQSIIAKWVAVYEVYWVDWWVLLYQPWIRICCDAIFPLICRLVFSSIADCLLRLILGSRSFNCLLFQYIKVSSSLSALIYYSDMLSQAFPTAVIEMQCNILLFLIIIGQILSDFYNCHNYTTFLLLPLV